MIGLRVDYLFNWGCTCYTFLSLTIHSVYVEMYILELALIVGYSAIKHKLIVTAPHVADCITEPVHHTSFSGLELLGSVVRFLWQFVERNVD